MTVLESLVAAIKDKTAESSVDVSQMDPKIWAAADGIVRQAKIELDKLKIEYSKELTRNLVLIATTGEYSAKFAKLAAKAKFLTVDFTSVVQGLSQRVKERCGRDEFDGQEYGLLLDELNKIKKEHGVIRMPMPKNERFSEAYGQSIEVATKYLVERTYGADLYAMTARKEITDKAMEDLFDKGSLPVIVYNYVEDDGQKILPAPIVTVEVPETVNGAFVKKVLDDIKKQCQSEVEGENNG